MPLFFAIAILITAIAAHALICRLPVRGSAVTRFMFVGGSLALVLATVLIEDRGLTHETLSALLLYGFACEMYIFLFTMAMSSISANLILNLARRKLTQVEIDHMYDSERMVKQRLDRLVSTGLLQTAPEGLRLTAKGASLVRVFELLHKFFRQSPPGQSEPKGRED